MIFIYEAQEKMDPGCGEKYKITFPIRQALHQYRFLHELDLGLLIEIKEIFFIYEGQLDVQIYKSAFSRYSLDFASYSGKKLKKNLSAESLIPKYFKEKENEEEKKDLIVALIKKQRLIQVGDCKKFLEEHLQEKDILIFLPYKKEITSLILENLSESKKLTLFSSSEQAKTNDGPPIIPIERELYFETNKNLRAISDEKTDYLENDDYNNYRPQNLSEILRDALSNQLKVFHYSKIKRAQIVGKDSFLADKVIELLLQTDKYIPYDLKLGIPKKLRKNEPVVFTNVHLIDSDQSFKKLSNITKDIDKLTYIILQAMHLIIVKYFARYPIVELPDPEKIRKTISGIFVSFLVERDPYREDYHKLKSSIQSNSFLNLLSDFDNLNNLNFVFGRLREISAEDLLTNTELWCVIINKMKQLEAISKDRQIDPIHYLFAYDEKNKIWSITKEVEEVDYDNALGVMYLCAIYWYYKSNNTSPKFDASKLRKFVADFDPKTANKYKLKKSSLTNFKTIDACFTTRPKKDKNEEGFDLINDLYTNHIGHDSKQFWFKPNNDIDINIDYLEMEKAFFKLYPKKDPNENTSN